MFASTDDNVRVVVVSERSFTSFTLQRCQLFSLDLPITVKIRVLGEGASTVAYVTVEAAADLDCG